MSRLTRPASLDDLLLYRISRLLATGGGAVIRLCEGRYGITRREWRVLALLAREGELLSSQLAQRGQLDRARTSKAVTSLVAKQLVSRTVQPGDRRQAAVALTAAGQALFAELFPQVCAINEELLSVLPVHEADKLDAMLDSLQAGVDSHPMSEQLPKANRREGGRRPRAPG
jgi:DNA-binding MarR family transcriptional regulator